LLAEFDTNKDGNITSAEALAVFQTKQQARVSDLLTEFDANSDGEVSAAEIAAARQSHTGGRAGPGPIDGGPGPGGHGGHPENQGLRFTSAENHAASEYVRRPQFPGHASSSSNSKTSRFGHSLRSDLPVQSCHPLRDGLQVCPWATTTVSVCPARTGNTLAPGV